MANPKVVISIETVLKGLNKTVQGLDQVEKQLRRVAQIRVGQQTSTQGFDKSAASAQRLIQQQQRLIVQAQELANRQERARQSAERLAISQKKVADAASNAAQKLGKNADAHVKNFLI